MKKKPLLIHRGSGGGRGGAKFAAAATAKAEICRGPDDVLRFLCLLFIAEKNIINNGVNLLVVVVLLVMMMVVVGCCRCS